MLEKDIEALVGEKVSEVSEVYELVNFQISSGNNVISMATVCLKKNDNLFTEAATGDGPVNAAFNAIERTVGFSLELQDYSLKGVTEGADALGEAKVRVTKDGRTYIGRGVSTDIIEASVKAYLNAINRVISEMEKGTMNNGKVQPQ